MLFKPILMLLMNSIQIIYWDFILFRSLSQFSSFMTLFRRASEINNFCFVHSTHLFKIVIKRFEYIIFSFIHITKVFHQLRENVFVCQNTSFWYLYLIRESLACLLECLNSSKDSINLESKTPTIWLFIVFLKNVNILST